MGIIITAGGRCYSTVFLGRRSGIHGNTQAEHDASNAEHFIELPFSDVRSGGEREMRRFTRRDLPGRYRDPNVHASDRRYYHLEDNHNLCDERIAGLLKKLFTPTFGRVAGLPIPGFPGVRPDAEVPHRDLPKINDWAIVKNPDTIAVLLHMRGSEFYQAVQVELDKLIEAKGPEGKMP